MAAGSGLLGFASEGFLTPLHAYALGVHLSSSMIFDAGVYLAVLGLVMVAVNLLGTSAAVGGPDGEEETRERTDESIEGELPGPLETVRGERAPRRRPVGAGTSHLSSGTQPKEAGRR